MMAQATIGIRMKQYRQLITPGVFVILVMHSKQIKSLFKKIPLE